MKERKYILFIDIEVVMGIKTFIEVEGILKEPISA